MRGTGENAATGRGAGFFLAGVSFVAAALLVWVGWALTPSDTQAMDGFERLLFTVVSIRLFSWLGAGVFAVLGVILMRHTSKAAPARGGQVDGGE